MKKFKKKFGVTAAYISRDYFNRVRRATSSRSNAETYEAIAELTEEFEEENKDLDYEKDFRAYETKINKFMCAKLDELRSDGDNVRTTGGIFNAMESTGTTFISSSVESVNVSIEDYIANLNEL